MRHTQFIPRVSCVISFYAAWCFAAVFGIPIAVAGDQINLRWEISTEVGDLQSLELSPDGQLFVVAGLEEPSSFVSIYEVGRTIDGELMRRVRTQVDGVRQVRFSSAGNRLVFKATLGFGFQISLEDGPTFGLGRNSGAWALAPDNSTVAVATSQINLGRPPSDFRLDVGRLGSSTLYTKPDYPGVVAFSPDGEFLAAGSNLLNADDGSSVRGLQWEGTLRSLSFSPDGEFVYGAHASGIVRVCSVADGTLYARITAHTNAVTGLGLALNGRAIATANGQSVKLWSREDGVLLRDLGEQLAGASYVKVTEDGATLIAAWSDGKLVALENPFAPKLEIRFSQAELVATGVAGQSYELQSSTNLLDWGMVTNYTSNRAEVSLPLDTSSGHSTRFWRLISR